MSQIMDSGIRGSRFCGNLFVVGVKSLGMQMVTDPVREDQTAGGVWLTRVNPVLPYDTGLQAAFQLLSTDIAENVYHEGSRVENTGPVIFQGCELKASRFGGALLELLADSERAFLKVHAVPGQPQGLRFTQSGEENYL